MEVSNTWRFTGPGDANRDGDAVIPVLDQTGKVREWLESGRGVNVWSNKDLGSYDVGGKAFTPADVPGSPGWRYGDTPDETIRDASAGRFVFYLRSHVLATWSDTPVGFRAAWKFLDRLNVSADHFHKWEHIAPKPSPYERWKISGRSVLIDRRRTWDAPIGRVFQTWTVEQVRYETVERVVYPLAPVASITLPGPLPEVQYDRPKDRPLDVLFYAGIVVWTAHTPAGEGK